MLDDGDGDGVAVVVGGADGGVGVRVVVVAHGLAVELSGVRHSSGDAGRRVDGGGLGGVLAVAQRGEALVGGADVLGQRRRRGLSVRVLSGGGAVGLDLLGEPGGDGGVVGGGVGEGLGGELAALGEREAAVGDGVGDGAVLGGVGDDGDRRVVLRGGADHGGAADVDLLDAGVEAGAGGDRVGEGVEVDDDEVDGRDLELGELGHVLVLAAVGEDAGVDAGVEGLDAALEALGEAGDVLDAGDGQAGGGDRLGGRAGGDDLDAGVDEGAGEVGEAGLVVDGDEGPLHGHLLGVDESLGGDVGGGDGLLAHGVAPGCAGVRAGRPGGRRPVRSALADRPGSGSTAPRWWSTLASRGQEEPTAPRPRAAPDPRAAPGRRPR